MGGWTKSAEKPSCCQGCTKRKPGCHDVKKCPDWANEVKKRRKEKEVREAQRPVVRKSWEDRRMAWQ